MQAANPSNALSAFAGTIGIIAIVKRDKIDTFIENFFKLNLVNLCLRILIDNLYGYSPKNWNSD
jgi:hypothetical protein